MKKVSELANDGLNVLFGQQAEGAALDTLLLRLDHLKKLH
jgi:hypothetical protein